MSSSEISHIDIAWKKTRGVRIGQLLEGPVEEAVHKTDREVEWFESKRWAENEPWEEDGDLTTRMSASIIRSSMA